MKAVLLAVMYLLNHYLYCVNYCEGLFGNLLDGTTSPGKELLEVVVGSFHWRGSPVAEVEVAIGITNCPFLSDREVVL